MIILDRNFSLGVHTSLSFAELVSVFGTITVKMLNVMSQRASRNLF